MWRTNGFSDELARKSLGRYFAVADNRKLAKFLVAKKVAADFNNTDSLDILWAKHAKCIEGFRSLERQLDNGMDSASIAVPVTSYLDLKIRISQKILENCLFCTRRCGVSRLAGKLGYCGCGSDAINVSSIFAHMGEEPELVPSGTIFTMGCTIRCLHCQNWTISQWKDPSIEYKPQELAKEVENLRLEGCRNVNLVGGEPTPWLWHWLETFRYVNINVPVVWNSNSYYSQETVYLLAGFADVYLLDFKYGPGDCAKRISDAANYWDVCTRNLLEAKRYGELIVRVLVLPDHLDCCIKPILQWIAENLGVETRVNLMFQYRPQWRAHEVPELHRRVSSKERAKAQRLAKEVGLVNLVP